MPYYRNPTRKREGLEAAQEHIRQANVLSGLLGGTDKTVKRYFFNLPYTELDRVLKEYGKLHSELAEEYARETMPKWASGRVQMSGMIAERLYKLLPPRMPLSTKFEIAEELWRHVGPSSHMVLRFGETADYPQITKTIERHITDVVENYKIPDSLQNRFDWLAGNEIDVKQELLNHLQNLDKSLVIQSANLQAKSMLEHLSTERSGFTQFYSHTVAVGKHRLQLTADNKVEGCRLEDYKPVIDSRPEKKRGIYQDEGTSYTWIFWVIGIAFICWLLVKFGI